MFYWIIRGKHQRHEMTAAQVWEKADEGKITMAQAFSICGPRPKEADEGTEETGEGAGTEA